MIYDFYYSEEHEKYLDSIAPFCDDLPNKTTVNGKKYTEMAQSGITPETKHFKDLKKILTADINKVSIKIIESK